MTQQDHLEAFDENDAQPDISGEHADTAVDKDITGDRDEGEPESPEGWSGMESDGAP